MKLRSLVLTSVMLAGAAFGAEVTSSQILGWMKVESSQTNTVIAVPWLGVGGGDVQVAKLVKTDNLTAGDKLYLYDGAKYNGWVLSSGAWTPLTTISTVAGVTEAAGADAATIARGAALWLVRQNPTDQNGPIPFYLYGQHSADASSFTITANAWNLIANPNAEAFDLNGAKKFAGGAADKILVPSDSGAFREYTYEGDAWGYDTFENVTIGSITVKNPVRTTTGCTIPAGMGCWYVSGGGTPTINW